MTKRNAAVLFASVVILVGVGAMSAASAAGFRGAGGGAPHMAAPAPHAVPSFAPHANFGAGAAAPHFGVPTTNHFGIRPGMARGPAFTPNIGGQGNYFRTPNGGRLDRHFAGRHRLNPYYPFGLPYYYGGYGYGLGYSYGPGYGYGTGLGVPYNYDGSYGTLTTTGACYPLLKRYRRTHVTKWLRRYDRCLAGDLSQLKTLS